MGERGRALAPAMSKPSRPSDKSAASFSARTFFVTTRTAGGRSLFQANRMAELLIEVLREKMRSGKMAILDFVIMPDHVHVLLTVPGEGRFGREGIPTSRFWIAKAFKGIARTSTTIP
jgi:hypothetical protein